MQLREKWLRSTIPEIFSNSLRQLLPFYFREQGAQKEIAERKARQEAKEAEDRMKAELERQRERKKKEEEERIRYVDKTRLKPLQSHMPGNAM